MILCHCAVVNDQAVVDAIHNGAETLADVCRSTGAGKNCGACIFTLKRLLCEHGALIVPCVHFSLTPREPLGRVLPRTDSDLQKLVPLPTIQTHAHVRP